ncbi:RE1-silencing transcription factor isoform X1 [Fundulus heteroclitus]|uniref:RE1-silencing transcription factor isoform X1 n=1 Tax=Fundulus heteroclitus TaxID=8078 RepID=UPI00165AB3E5|nr:RE1-silencing transcription factor isoform X1 [Fundulus heteroclitus]XP_021169589.2 RE1-silencing transcription factor isoform X1 [Fundulus heteroclitus]
MATQTMFSAGMFPVSVSLAEDGPVLGDLPRNAPPAPQLVMLANVAAVTAAEGGDGSVADEKEMMELKTVGCSYSDSEDEGIIRYSYDNQNQREVCIVEYPESPSPAVQPADTGKEDEENHAAKTQPACLKLRPAAGSPAQGVRGKDAPPGLTDGAQKKKPFCCKPCHFQGQNEQEFVAHLSTHGVSKMMVGNQVEGRSKSKGKEAESCQASSGKQVDDGGEAEPKGEEAAGAGDVKGLIRCERCGYNTNRYDHYIAHLKHHSKEGDNHRVFKCTLCAYTTVSQYHWRKHLRNHFPSKLHTCSQCSYFSDRKSNYIQHIRTHTGVRPFQCLYCDYSSSQKTHLTRHMRTHSGERPFKCESCSYLAANQHEVTRHARQVHNGPKPLSCPFCDYKTADRSNFKKHVELHLNPRQFLCPLCKYAASKKCNLQYHIKSRHSGCHVDLDVSKVKLRVKKAGPDEADDKPESKAAKPDGPPAPEEDVDEGDDASPINLSIRRSGRPGAEPPARSKTPDKAAKKRNVSSEKERTTRAKEVEKKVSSRQKKVKENPAGNMEGKEGSTAAGNTDTCGKKRVRKVPTDGPTESAASQEKRPEEPASQKDRPDPKSSEQKTAPESTAEKDLASHKKTKGLGKTRKSGSRKTPEDAGAPIPGGPEKIQKGKWVKEQPAKRKAGPVLDLSQKPSKKRRLKAAAAEKLPSDPSSDGSDPTETAPAKQNKTRTSTRKSSDLRPAAGPVRHESSSETSPSPEAVESSAQPSTSGSGETGSSSGGAPHPEPDGAPCRTPENTEVPPPTFVKPSVPPRLLLPGQRGKPADGEDDEGIHSSHEAGSDISDSASEGSDDSGLNGTGTASGKMANDPETPTEEIPTPTEVKSHTCIFCDRTFPLETQYRRHLNRHLVNVYYMDPVAPK